MQEYRFHRIVVRKLKILDERQVTGRRLDGPAPPLVVPRATNGVEKDLKSFMLVGADIPTHGCWEIKGRYKGDELKFVVSVVP